MKMIHITSALSAVAALGIAATSAHAKPLTPGNYEVAGIQQICLVSDQTWYGETFPNWGGRWGLGPHDENATILWGTYNNGAGIDSMVISSTKRLFWTEFASDSSVASFIDDKFTKIKGACAAPAAQTTGKHKKPMD